MGYPLKPNNSLTQLEQRVTDLEDELTAIEAGAVESVFGRTGIVTAQTNDYTWAQIDKSTSSLADITTRSASDLSSGTLSIGRGGTGQGTATTAFDALSPMTVLGDLIYGGASGTRTKLGGNTSSTRKFLRQTGDGANSAAPAWDTLTSGDIPDISGTYQPLDSDLTTIAGLTATTDNFLVAVSSAWASRTPAQVKTTLSLNNVDNTSDVTKNAASVALTNKDLTSGTNTFPTLNQNTTGSAAKWTTARNLAGNSVDGSANVAFANKFIVQGTTDTGLSGAQFLGSLGTGILKNTTTTGVLSIAVAGDFPTLNQNTTGSAATLTTARAIYGNNFDGSAALTQIIASTYGGTGNGFAKLSGPATSEKTFTLPNASATILTDNAAVTVPQGGTGAATLTGILKGNGTSAFTAVTAPSGAIVGDTDTQTLTNKNLTSTTNTFPTGAAVQQVDTLTNAEAHGTGTIPADDTIPQNTEGTEFMTLAITPKSSTNKLIIEAVVQLTTSAVANTLCIAALFQDTTANALAANWISMPASGNGMQVKLYHSMTAGTTSSTTFKIRGGGNNAGTTTFNGLASARFFGAITHSYLRITEVAA